MRSEKDFLRLYKELSELGTAFQESCFRLKEVLELGDEYSKTKAINFLDYIERGRRDLLDYHPRREAGRLAIRNALPHIPGDMLDHGLFAALKAMGVEK